MCSKFSFVLGTEYSSRYIKLVLFEDYNNTIQADMSQLFWLTVVYRNVRRTTRMFLLFIFWRRLQFVKEMQ